MNLPRYEVKAEKSLMVFEFLSEGPEGKIQKIVKYSETNTKGVFNLAFGDKHPSTGDIDDFAISNNGDREKILVTVVATIYAFTDKHPNSWIYATGSTKARTRLYRMGLSRHFEEMQKEFEIFGLRNEEWNSFVKDEEYDAFLARRKI